MSPCKTKSLSDPLGSPWDPVSIYLYHLNPVTLLFDHGRWQVWNASPSFSVYDQMSMPMIYSNRFQCYHQGNLKTRITPFYNIKRKMTICCDFLMNQKVASVREERTYC